MSFTVNIKRQHEEKHGFYLFKLANLDIILQT